MYCAETPRRDQSPFACQCRGGGFGWASYMKNEDNNISVSQLYSYIFNTRNEFNRYFNIGKLSQQYVLDAWIKVESS